MQLIVSGRQTGKTTRLIQMCAREGGYIVCHSHAEAYRVVQEAEKMGLDIPFPLTPQEFLGGGYYDRVVQQFYVDNLDIILQAISHVPIKAVTWNEEG